MVRTRRHRSPWVSPGGRARPLPLRRRCVLWVLGAGDKGAFLILVVEGERLHITNAGSAPSRWVGLTWIVERTFAWLGRNRRLSKDYELKVQTSEAVNPEIICESGRVAEN